MNHYYLVSSLPYLKPGIEPPVRSRDFLAQCAAQLPASEVAALTAVSLIPRATAASPVEARWNQHETYLRNTLIRVRASQRHHHEVAGYLRPEGAAFGGIENAVRDAYNRDPFQLEEQIDRLRWRFLDDLTIGHEFDFTAVFVYHVKLLLLEKRIGLDVTAGQRCLDEIVAARLHAVKIF
ncbi:DUF2764 family protein [Gammaproteobacteria bacterium]